MSPGKFRAECKYCLAKWKRGETVVLEEHLANHCPNAPVLVLRSYMAKLKDRVNISNKKRKVDAFSDGQTIMKDFHDSTAKLPEGRRGGRTETKTDSPELS